MRSGQLDEATLRQKYIVEFKPKEHAALHIRERNKKEEE